MWLALWEMAPVRVKRAIVGAICLLLVGVGFVNRDAESRLGGWIATKVVHQVCVEEVEPLAERMLAAFERQVPASPVRPKHQRWCP
jgi:hypothetical protein